MYIKLIQPKMKKKPMDTFQHAAEISKYMFIDDNFAGNPDWTKMFLKEIKPMKLKWNAAVSINVANDPRLLDLMRNSGCQSLFIGFESINPESVSGVHHG